MSTLSRTLPAISPPTSAITKPCGLNPVPSVSSRLWTIITRKPMEKNTAVIKPLRNSSFILATDGDMMCSHPLRMLERACGPNLRRSHWLRHPVKDHHALTAAAGRERLGRRLGDADVNVLPVVHGPHIAG